MVEIALGAWISTEKLDKSKKMLSFFLGELVQSLVHSELNFEETIKFLAHAFYKTNEVSP